jgi:hypothetical protein
MEIEQLINQKGGIEQLLNFMVHNQYEIKLRLSAALYLKNHIVKYWEVILITYKQLDSKFRFIRD